ncbi:MULTISPECIES: SRPBCC family protein [Nocardia]|uniref:SRPBCC family protein n=1 Tax=Nocardia TaxID=1817 RepID=UPI000BEF211C|nr:MULTISPECIES: SRPBCC family protein [Nocardia]MBF6185867.1 SRPBCC family protein [Nocardia farcinica]MBF6311712.1 SRPBCC family protein [Nocardia farcinica]MBF6408696.1 SRPBCC family protein [Nocardia farcinica]MBF6440523.1 SRPBCC family protein [Nocardia farcinica]MBF6519823.1 SRPBCC family protein [Nocardia farcinica]
MTTPQISEYGTLVEPRTVRLERLLPGPIERVWRYLTEAELRRSWLADGAMELTDGGPVELIFRNSELSTADDPAPDEYTAEHRIRGVILACEPPRLLRYTWGDESSEVTFALEPAGDQVRLEVTHTKLPDRSALLSVSGGWHSHLDLLAARLAGREPEAFWPKHARLREEYERRFAE